MDHDIFTVNDFALQSGNALPKAHLAYKTYGHLNESRDNVVVFPTWFCGRHSGNEWLIGEGRALDPREHFIIVPNLLGNGLSSSPSNTPAPFSGKDFPLVTAHDNVVLQHRLLKERFGVQGIELAVGWSMGALQAYEWASSHPGFVKRLAALCGSARTSRHNYVFLEGVKAALTADAAFIDGEFSAPASTGLRAMSRVYAGWALSQTFYRQDLDREVLGFSSLDEFFDGFWEPLFRDFDPNDILAMIATWQAADIGRNATYDGDFAAALRGITAKCLIMPCKTDLYFPPEDSEIEVSFLSDARLDVIPSIWGHASGAGINPTDIDYIDAALEELLAS
jgi:homoserine O-acetyltransferase